MDTPPPPSDRELVRQTQEGDPAAFDELFRRYEKKMQVMIYGILLHHEDTQDAVIETFLKAYQSIARFEGKAEFSTWLYTIAKNTAYNLLRKLKRRPQVTLPPEEDENFHDNNSFIDKTISSDVLRQMENAELQNKLNESLALLSEDHRTVVTLFDVQEMSHAEIAKVMGCSEGTVRSRLFYAHKQLQKYLKNYS